MSKAVSGSETAATFVWPKWYAELEKFQKGSYVQASWQLANSLLPYFALWYVMVLTLERGYPYPLTLALALVAAAFLVRIFIIFHDCAHGSFTSSKGFNTLVGYLCGVLTFTSLEDWRFGHLRHHVTFANLDARGYGDIWTMTLKEFTEAPKLTRLAYRLYRNPLVLFGLGAVFNFVLSQRLPTRKVHRREWSSVIFTNLLVLLVVIGASRMIGFKTYLLVQVPVIWLAGIGGIWLFYVQHQFKGAKWTRQREWNPLSAAFEGSSLYALPSLMRWFSGNIGYHHVHHLRPRIPNYNLKVCYDSIPALKQKEALTLGKSVAFYRLKLWDEEKGILTGFPPKFE